MPATSLVYLRRLGNSGVLADALARDPALEGRSVDEQQAALEQANGPFSAPMARELARLGWDSSELILGVPSIRAAWVREHGPLPEVPGVTDPDVRLAVGEILRRSPEVVVDINISALDRWTVPYLREHVPGLRQLVGRMGTTKRYHKAIHLDVAIVPCGTIADAIRPVMPGSVRVLPHSFDPGLLGALPPRTVEHPIVFSGVLGPRYALRHELLMALLEATPIEAWIGLRKGVRRTDDGRLDFGARRRSLRQELVTRLPLPVLAAGVRRSPRLDAAFNLTLARRSGGRTDFPATLPDPWALFPERCHPPVSGTAYLELIRRSGIMVHRETDDLDGCGGALRLFEVTGAGAALLTDDSPMVRHLFDPDREVVTYRTVEEAVEKARWLLDHPDERERIAAAGHARTLRDHSTAVRAAELAALLDEER